MRVCPVAEMIEPGYPFEWYAWGRAKRRLRLEISAAISRYLARGGRIHYLPSQRTPHRPGVPPIVPGPRVLFDRPRPPSEAKELESWEIGLYRYNPAEWERQERLYEQRQRERADASRKRA